MAFPLGNRYGVGNGFKKGNPYAKIYGFQKGNKLGVGNKFNLGRPASEKQKAAVSQLKGEKHHNWKGGTSTLSRWIRATNRYKQWRSDVFKRDNWTCQTCGKRGYVEVHHNIRSYSSLVNDFLEQNKGLDKNIDKEKLVRISVDYEPFWDLNNGVSLCKECHSLTDTYCGKKGRLPFQS